MRKEIEFIAKLDTTEVDRAIERLQDLDKNRKDARDSKAGIVGAASNVPAGASPATQAAYTQATSRQNREGEQTLKQQKDIHDKINKVLADREARLKSLVDQQSSMVKGCQEELELRKEISRLEGNSEKLKKLQQQQDQTVVNASNPSGGGKGGKGGTSGGGKDGDGGDKKSSALAELGTIAAIAKATIEFMQYNASKNVIMEGAMGSAVSAGYGRDVNNIYQGKTSSALMFSKERSKSTEIATDKMEREKTLDSGRLILKALGGIIVTAGLASTFVGVPAAIATGFATFSMLALGGDKRQAAKFMGDHKTYNALVSADYAKDQMETYQNLIAQDPRKKAAVDYHDSNWERDLNFQRQTGMSDDKFYGEKGVYGPKNPNTLGFEEKATKAGFTVEQAMGMSQGILGAGGSTSMAGDSTFGSQMQRRYNLTNAGSMLGKLSGSIGDSESSKQGMVRIMSEAFKNGFDSSVFAEENRRFTEAATNVISRSGAKGSDEIERLTANFARFQTEKTNQGIDAGKSAYERYQEISSSTEGPRGIMRMAGYNKNKLLKKLNSSQRAALLQIPDEEFNESNPLVQAAANQIGGKTTAGDVISANHEVNEGAVNRRSETDMLRDKLRQKLVSAGKKEYTQENLNGFDKETQDLFYKFLFAQGSENAYVKGSGGRNAFSYASGTIGKNSKMAVDSRDWDKKTNKELNGSTDLLNDGKNKAIAADSEQVVQGFNSIRESMQSLLKISPEVSKMFYELGAAVKKDANKKSDLTPTLIKSTNWLETIVNAGKKQ